MKKSIGIMTDSYSGMKKEEAKQLGLWVLSMPFFVNGESYYEEETIVREEFYEILREDVTVSTSQPSPEAVMNMWNQMLEEYEEIIYIPLTSGLSGSCQTAMAMAMEEEYEGKVYVVDNGRISVPLYRSILDAFELVEEGFSAKEIKNILEENRANMSVYIGVDTLEYLKKGGRITASTAMIGNVLNIKPVLKLDVGLLETHKKCRGNNAMKKEMIKAMGEDLETRFKSWHDNGEVYLMAASSASKEDTAKWVEQIREAFPGMEVVCHDLPMGVACHTGGGALGIGCSCRPKR